MKIIVGLGNPGEEYKDTRHNTGFIVVDEIVKSEKLKVKSYSLKFKVDKKFKAEIYWISQIGQIGKLLLVKPLTYMNSSGIAVKKIIDYYLPPPSEEPLRVTSEVSSGLYIVHDDLDIPLGEYKIQFGRSSAGHKGVESIIKELGTRDFWRIRIGIKSSPITNHQLPITEADYVLQKFSKKEKIIIDKVIEQVVNNLNRFQIRQNACLE